jgi:hypothetical protein
VTSDASTTANEPLVGRQQSHRRVPEGGDCGRSGQGEDPSHVNLAGETPRNDGEPLGAATPITDGHDPRGGDRCDNHQMP